MNIRWLIKQQQFPRYSLLVSLLASITTSWSPAVAFTRRCTSRIDITRTIMASSLSSNNNNNNNIIINPLDVLGLPSPVLLGSASFTRKLILKEMGIPYHIIVRSIDEQTVGDRNTDLPTDLVAALGKAKADYLVQEIRAGRCDDELPPQEGTLSIKGEGGAGIIVLTGDQVVTCAGKILEKPESIEEAKAFVSQYPTHPPSTVGSCVLTHVPSGIQVSGVDTATVHFRSNFSGADLVDELLAEDQPILSCAGGLMVEHPKTKANIERIDGTEASVMGLSKELVLRLLEEMAQELRKANVL